MAHNSAFAYGQCATRFAFAAAPLKILVVDRISLSFASIYLMERQSLKDADISSRRNVNRRTFLHSLGVGAAAVAATIGTGVTAQAQPKPQPKPADPCRDRDRGPSDQDGCPSSPIS